MIKFIIETKEVQKISEVTCDICKKNFDTKKDELEIQEFVYIRDIGGYNSVFGDGVEIHYDICQHCFYDFVMGINTYGE